MKVVWVREAEVDAREAYNFYEERQLGLGFEFLGALDEAIATIASRPGAYKIWPGSQVALGVRQYRMARFPYFVGYLLRQDDVVILVVSHARRRPGFWFGRLEAP